MFNRIHTRGRRIIFLFRADDGRFIKNAIIFFGSYVLCVSAIMLFRLVIGLIAHKAGVTSHRILSESSHHWFDQGAFCISAAILLLFEEKLFRLPIWYRQILFALITFLTIYLFLDNQYSGYGTDNTVYLHAAAAWAVAACVYILGPHILLQSAERARLRCLIYISLGLLGLIQQGGYFQYHMHGILLQNWMTG